MEKINNEYGSSTIESVFIIPTIMIFIMVFIVLMLISYEKTVQVVSVHRKAMINEVEEFSIISETDIKREETNYSSKLNFLISGEIKEFKYEYKSGYIKVTELQKIVELVFYLIDKYEDKLEVMKKHDKQ